MTQAKIPDFRRSLLAQFQWGEERGRPYVDIRCGDLHDEVKRNGKRLGQ